MPAMRGRLRQGTFAILLFCNTVSPVSPVSKIHDPRQQILGLSGFQTKSRHAVKRDGCLRNTAVC